MTSPSRRSRTLRRVHVRTTSGKSKIQYKRRMPGKAQCGNCGQTLAGVPRALPYKMQNMSKSSKRPERAFGGVLCSACSKREIIARVRKE